jgi:hypothetical protein
MLFLLYALTITTIVDLLAHSIPMRFKRVWVGVSILAISVNLSGLAVIITDVTLAAALVSVLYAYRCIPYIQFGSGYQGSDA